MSKSSRLTLFPSEDQDISNMSAEFESTDGVMMIVFKGLKKGDKALVEFEMGDSECDPFWVPLVDCCGQVGIECPKTFLLLPLPLRYRIVLIDKDDNYLTDPSHFSDVMIQSFRINPNLNVADMYHSCCNEEVEEVIPPTLCELTCELPKGPPIGG